MPLLCLERSWALRNNGTPVLPDVWLADFAPNLGRNDRGEPPESDFAALLASLMRAPSRAHPWTAAINVIVSTSKLLRDPQGFDSELGSTLTQLPLRSAAQAGAPSVAYGHGVRAAFDAQISMEGTKDERGLNATRSAYLRSLCADNGTDAHFSAHGHRVMAEFLFALFVRAASLDPDSPVPPRPPDPDRDPSTLESDDLPPPDLPPLPPDASRILSSITGSLRPGSPPAPLECRLTLTHLGPPDLVPLSSAGFELRTHSTLHFGRTDVKRTYVPLAPNATAVFSIPLRSGARTLCMVIHADAGEELLARFADAPGVPACRFAHSSKHSAPVYRAVCGCPVPAGLADGREGRVEVSVGEGRPQVAGMAVH